MGPEGDDANVQPEGTEPPVKPVTPPEPDPAAVALAAAREKIAEYEAAEAKRKADEQAAAEAKAIEEGQYQAVIAEKEAQLAKLQPIAEAHEKLRAATAAANEAALKQISAALRGPIAQVSDPFLQRDIIAAHQATVKQGDVTPRRDGDTQPELTPEQLKAAEAYAKRTGKPLEFVKSLPRFQPQVAEA